ncbi:MAG: hypothetical protein AYL33_007320 [Candidatus Bathyarchaeota archaeon B63]|nr:MAG: hypothetical protein AYL33_007320 [Candidatus Bathyarchaeota archaeon B63]
MMNVMKKVGGASRKKGHTLRGEVFGVILLLLIALVGSFALQWALAIALQTSTPLHTPISRSMEPTLNVGDLLVIHGGLRGEDIHASPEDGDIIIFRSPRNPDAIPIVHRAIKKIQKDGKWYFETKGDNNNSPDPWLVPEDYIIGKVILVIPKAGYVLRSLDEVKIHIGGYSVTLRMLLLALDVLALFYLELTDRDKMQEKG